MKKIYLLVTLLIVACVNSFAQNAADYFVTKWDTRLASASGAADPNNATIVFGAISSVNSYDISYESEDGTVTGTEHFTSDFQAVTFPAPGIYTVRMYGVDGFNTYVERALPYAKALLEIRQWGTSHWTNLFGGFSGCSNMDLVATDLPDLSGVKDLTYLFDQCKSLVNSGGSISDWDVSSVENMYGLFDRATHFNQPLNKWNMSSVKDISFMFCEAEAFNQNINDWDVSNVTEMQEAFVGAISYNQPLDKWDVSSVLNFYEMFMEASIFNQDLSMWNVSNGKDFEDMFYYAEAYNQNLGAWNIKNATSVRDMLTGSGLDCDNYGNTLMGWASNSETPHNLRLGAEDLSYDEPAVAAHDALTSTLGWSITDDGLSIGCGLALPVKLIEGSFKGEVINNSVKLTWQTAIEVNSKGFNVEGSADGIHWENIGYVASRAVNGNSTTGFLYGFKDLHPRTGHNYYRLVEVNKNGSVKYSSVIDVAYSGASNLSVYPNPATDYIQVRVQKAGMVKIYALSGVLVKSFAVQAGVNNLSIVGLSKGAYIVKVGDSSTKLIKK